MNNEMAIDKKTGWMFAIFLVTVCLSSFVIKYSLIDSQVLTGSWGYYQKDWINLAVIAFNILLSSVILIRLKKRNISANVVIPKYLILSALFIVVIAIIVSVLQYNEYQLHPSSFIPVDVMIMSRIFTMFIPFYGIIFGSVSVVDIFLVPLILSLFIKSPIIAARTQVLNK